jgi:hypothetical protein
MSSKGRGGHSVHDVFIFTGDHASPLADLDSLLLEPWALASSMLLKSASMIFSSYLAMASWDSASNWRWLRWIPQLPRQWQWRGPPTEYDFWEWPEWNWIMYQWRAGHVRRRGGHAHTLAKQTSDMFVSPTAQSICIGPIGLECRPIFGLDGCKRPFCVEPREMPLLHVIHECFFYFRCNARACVLVIYK